MTSTADVEKNLAKARKLMAGAAEAGADLIALPENFAYLRREGEPALYKQELEGELVGAMREEAVRHGCYLLLGSIPERVPRSRRVFNTSVLIGPNGKLLAHYRKMHLFDIDIRGGATLKESRSVAPGDRPVVADTPLGKLGMSVCYDLRFPELYRRLVFAGAKLLFVPAAFTSFTGPHHWLPLLRARAIENQCWVVAPAQVGRHGPGRQSHGESAIIDPWGGVVQRLPKRQGWIMAEIDMAAVDKVRRGLPCLNHVRKELL
jgi:predicted amidohydrolase